MRSTTLVLLSFTYLASATDEGSAFGEDIPVVAPKRSKLTLRKPTPTDEESESAFGDVDFLKDESVNKRETLSSKPGLRKKPAAVQEESAFGDVDDLQDVAQDAHIAPSSAPTLRKKNAPGLEEESAFGDVPELPDNGDSSSANGMQQLGEHESLVEESALGGALKDDSDDDLDDKEIKDESEQSLSEMRNTKSGFVEEGESALEEGEKHERHSEEVHASAHFEKKCTGPQCEADKWSPVRNVHAYGPSGKPANWKPRKIIGNGKELMSDEQPRARGARIYSRHQAVEHQAPSKRSLGEFVSSFLER
jgi:hypothetical protein